MTTVILTVTGAPQPLDLLLFRRYGRETKGLVEQVYADNPGLAALGPVLPLGTDVAVTPPTPPPAKPKRKVVQLYS